MVGAGPGDIDLITIKGVKALKKADVVLYDALANEELLAYCRPDCHLVYVGKKPGIHQYQQIYINDMIVDFAREHEHIVRLKGGDPYVFGRGHEELEHAEEHGLEVEVIPGITSAIAVPALAGIPVTKRGINESFWVITGTNSSLRLSSDIYLAAKSSATVIILMGMRHLSEIVKIFKVSRGVDAAIGIIQNGSRSNQKTVTGKLKNIENIVCKKEITSPAVIVLGEVVRLSPSWHKSALDKMVEVA